MAQITWRNIDAPDLGGAARIMDVGSNNIRDAIQGVLGLSQQQANLSNLNFDTARTRNTADLQNSLLGINDPSQLDAQRDQFAPEALRSQYGAAYDQNAINQLLQQRPQQLRQELTSQIQLTDLQKQQASQPYENQFYSLLASNPAQAEAFLRQNEANFADSRQLYGDLTNRRQQIEQMGLQRAQLAESRAARGAANAERQAAAQERGNLRNYAQELNQWRLDNPDKPIGAQAASLQKRYGINPVMGNQVTSAIQQNFQTLGAPTAQQAGAIESATAQVQQAAAQSKEDATREVNATFLSSGIDPAFLNLQGDTKTTGKDVIGTFRDRLSDPNESTEAYTRVKKIYPNATPATIGYILEQSLQPNTFTDGVSINFNTVESNAERARQTGSNTKAKQAYTDALRMVDDQTDQLLQQAQQPINAFARQIPAYNLGASKQAPVLQPVVPDFSASRRELRDQLQKQLNDPTLNSSTVNKRVNR